MAVSEYLSKLQSAKIFGVTEPILVPRLITFFHAQLSIKFSLPINMKMPTIVGIFILLAETFSCSAMFSKKEFATDSNLRFISRINFMLS